MAMLCAFDWRHGLVTAQLTRDADGSLRLALGHGPHEVVVHLSQDSLDALTLAGLTCPRPKGEPPWTLQDLSCF
jgi:hypothetical protein